MNFEFLKSKTFWSFVVLVVINAINANKAFIPAEYIGLLDAVIGILGTYFHIDSVAKAAQTGRARI
jgi:hypothetical protein